MLLPNRLIITLRIILNPPHDAPKNIPNLIPSPSVITFKSSVKIGEPFDLRVNTLTSIFKKPTAALMPQPRRKAFANNLNSGNKPSTTYDGFSIS